MSAVVTITFKKYTQYPQTPTATTQTYSTAGTYTLTNGASYGAVVSVSVAANYRVTLTDTRALTTGVLTGPTTANVGVAPAETSSSTTQNYYSYYRSSRDGAIFTSRPYSGSSTTITTTYNWIGETLIKTTYESRNSSGDVINTNITWNAPTYYNLTVFVELLATQYSVTSGAITFQGVANFYGRTQPYKFSQLYKGGGTVPNIALNANIPTSGAIKVSNFYGCWK